MHQILPYIEGVACSICYGYATILDQTAVKRQAKIDSLNPSHILRLFKQRSYLLATFLDLVGWLFFLLAARRLPLYLDLSFVALSLVVTAIISHYILKVKTLNSEIMAIILVVVGIILLGIVAQPTAAAKVTKTFIIVLEFTSLPIAIIGLYYLKNHNKKYSALILASLSGLTFGITGIISRIIHISNISISQLFQSLTFALIIFGGLGIFFLAASLQRERINRVNSVLYSSELALPSLIGIIYLGDSTKNGLWPITILGFVLVFFGTIIIATHTKSQSV